MPNNPSNINIGELNRDLSQNVIHYDPMRIDYAINDNELAGLEEYGNSIWKDVFLATVGIGVPCLLNAYIAQKKLPINTNWTNEIFFNYLIGGITFGLSIVAFFVWRSNSKKKKNIIQHIKSKPPFKLPT